MIGTSKGYQILATSVGPRKLDNGIIGVRARQSPWNLNRTAHRCQFCQTWRQAGFLSISEVGWRILDQLGRLILNCLDDFRVGMTGVGWTGTGQKINIVIAVSIGDHRTLAMIDNDIVIVDPARRSKRFGFFFQQMLVVTVCHFDSRPLLKLTTSPFPSCLSKNDERHK